MCKYVHIKSDVEITFQNQNIILSRREFPTVKLSGVYIFYLYFICKNLTIATQIEQLSQIFKCDKTEISMHYYEFLDLMTNFCYLSETISSNHPIPIRNLKKFISSDDKNLNERTRKDSPLVVSLSITPFCYMNCIYCYANAKIVDHKVKSMISLERFRCIVDEAAKMGVESFELTGGDPFCVENIVDYMKILVNSGMRWNVSTKNYIPIEQARELKSIGINKLQVSMDSHNPETVEYLTNRKDGFDILIKTIRNLIAADINVRIKTVLSSVNIREIPDFLRFLTSEGVTEVSFSWYGSLCGRSLRSLYPTQNDIVWLNEQIDQMQKESFIPIDYVKLGTEFSTFINSSLFYKHYYRKKCGASRYRMAINWRGDVCFCEYLLNENELMVGNINESSLQELWSNKKMLSLIYPNRGYFEHTECYNCQLFESCYERRCFLRSKYRYGTVFEKDPWCKYGDTNYYEY